jgi:hypothetical protein
MYRTEGLGKGYREFSEVPEKVFELQDKGDRKRKIE